jgi:membrane associated rhomboid family serine protease
MDIENPADTTSDKRRLRIAFTLAFSFVLLLWVLKLIEYLGGFDFTQFGIYPRRAAGLVGILCAPFIHASVPHLLANSPPIIVIGTMLFYGYPRASRVFLPVVYLGSGIAVWLFARQAYHIGSSGLAFGMLFFVCTVGVLRWERRTIAISLLVFFLYGGMISGIVPGASEVSFESHLSGSLIGILLAFLLRNRDPEPSPRRYRWEDEETESDDFDWPDRK